MATSALSYHGTDARDAITAGMSLSWSGTRRWGIVVLLGVVLGIVDSSQSYVLGKFLGVTATWVRIFSSNTIYWAACAALIPLVFFLANRFRLDGTRRYWHFVVHCAGAVAFMLLHAVVYLGLAFWMPLRPGDTQLLLFVRMIRDYAAADFLIYWAIVATFYWLHYYRESQRRALAEAQLQTTLTETRLEVLRSQLAPHFLFNTLNSISTLALKGENDATAEMIARLSDLLRVSLDDQCPQRVTLAKELEFLDRYLDIQRIRFADRLKIRHRVSPEAQDALVPSMILQPLAENAICHGIDARVGVGVITIESERRNDTLHLRVTDSGPGFPSEGWETRRQGLGLANTCARLEQLYGPHQQLVFGCSEDGGGAVTVTIPFHTIHDPGADALTGSPS